MRRFDATALYRALDERRTARGQSWREVADAIGVSVATITPPAQRRPDGSRRDDRDGRVARRVGRNVCPRDESINATHPRLGVAHT